jgi:histidine triad (HIT) family protein
MTSKIYDPHNIFAKILRGEIPNKTIFENEYALAFHDIYPKAAVHALVIPKGAYVDMVDFGARASSAEITGFYQAVSHVVSLLNIEHTGCRMISNCGINGGQEVPHFHVHILGGERLGAMIGS